MTDIETYGEIESGVLKIYRRKDFLRSIAAMKDCRVVVTVKRQYKRRSTEQNGYYWGVIVNECQQGYFDMTGDQIDKDAAHEILKLKCNKVEVTNEKTGEVLTVGGSTAAMTTTEMSEYWLRCCEFLREFFGRDVPGPGEQMEIWNESQ